jgi:hypothetical protein
MSEGPDRSNLRSQFASRGPADVLTKVAFASATYAPLSRLVDGREPASGRTCTSAREKRKEVLASVETLEKEGYVTASEAKTHPQADRENTLGHHVAIHDAVRAACATLGLRRGLRRTKSFSGDSL